MKTKKPYNEYLTHRRYIGANGNKIVKANFDADFNKIYNYIGVFLNQNIIIENYLDDILMIHLAKNKNGFNGAGFKSLILNSRSLSIFDKSKIFGDLTKSTFLFFKLVDKNKAKIFRKTLNKIIEHINIIAHNRFGIHYKMKTAIFEYYQGGEKNQLELTDKKITEYLESANQVIDYLKNFKPILLKHEDR